MSSVRVMYVHVTSFINRDIVSLTLLSLTNFNPFLKECYIIGIHKVIDFTGDTEYVLC